jgi:hypothetical protein
MDALLGDGKGNLNHFWKEVSYTAINLSGSKTFGWFVMSQPSTSYDEDSYFAMGRDCIASAGSAVDLSQFYGVNIAFNLDTFPLAWGGFSTYDIGGVVRVMPTTWTKTGYYPWNHLMLAHEMGHGFGLPHSRTEYTSAYGSPWDFMSSGAAYVNPNTIWPVNTIAFHKSLLGWIAPSERIRLENGTHRFVLRNLSNPDPGEGVLVAEAPVEGGHITLEARSRIGYDAGITPKDFKGPAVPGEGVVVHRINGSWSSISQPGATVIDFDGIPYADDAGSVLEVGEIGIVPFPGSNVRIEVLGRIGTGFEVLVSFVPDYPLSASVAGSGSLTSKPPGIDCPNECIHNFVEGTPVQLTPHPNPGWLFVGWEGSCVGQEECVLETGSTQSVTAHFLQPNIDVAADHFLGGPFLPADLQRSFDGQGNDNGVYDLGDLVAFIARERGE